MRLAPLAPIARLLPLSALAVASLALTACDPGAGTPSPSASATGPAPTSAAPSLTASPVVTPSPPAHDPHPPLAGLVITTSGLLPLTIGQAIAGNPGEAMLEWNATACDPAFTDPAALGRWQATYPEIPDHGRPFLVDGEIDGVLRRIDINSPALSTREGIHQGSPVTDLVAAYPGLTTGAAGWDALHVHWIQDAHGTIVFETDTMNVDGTVGPDHVAFIRVLASGIDPDWTVSQSGNIAGACM